jgi:hypothetical protein
MSETARRSRRLALLYAAGAPLPGQRTPMSNSVHERLQRAVLMETLTAPADAEIRTLCHRLIHEESPE